MTEPKTPSAPSPDTHQPDQDAPSSAVESSTIEDIQDANLDGVAGGFKIIYHPNETGWAQETDHEPLWDGCTRCSAVGSAVGV